MELRKDRGFVLLSAALVLLLAGAFLALLADTAHLQYTRQRAQTAADAAAIGALHELERGNTAGMLEAARADAALNGVQTAEGATVDVDCPPRSGDFAGDTTAVEARIVARAPTLFMHLFGPAAITVVARAVALPGEGGGPVLGE